MSFNAIKYYAFSKSLSRIMVHYSGIYAKTALSFRCTLMILHLMRMRRNVNRNGFNDRKNESATPF